MHETPSRAKRILRVVYLKEDSFNEYAALTMKGLSKAAREMDVELVTYSGSTSFDARSFNYGIQALYGFIRETRPDGLLINAWLPEVREPHTRAFLDNFRGLPVFLLGSGHPGVHYAHLSGAEYMRGLVAHMVEHHGRRRVAFLSAYSPDDRDDAYIAYMKEKGLWDESLYLLGEKIRADMPAARAQVVMRILFDERKGPPPDAILASNTDEAVAILAALQQRNLKVPGDVAFASWEDGEIGRVADPPLTAVEYPYFELGHMGGAGFFRLLRGEKIPLETRVAARLFFRKSCGCSYLESILGDSRNPQTDSEAVGALADDHAVLLSLLGSAAGSPSPFLDKWDSYIEKDRGEHGYVALRAALSRLRRALTESPAPDTRESFGLLEIAQSMVDDASLLTLSKSAIMTARTQQILNYAGQDIITSRHKDAVLTSVAEATRSLSIGSCWIFLLAEGETAEEENASPGIGDPEKPLEKRRFQIALWLQNGTREIDKEGRRGLIGGFLKEILSERAAGRHFFGRVLHVRSSIQGFILFDLGEIDCRVFESLGLLTSSALRSAAILERLVRTQDELRDLAENDSLTGLGNRFSFYKRFRGLVEKPEAGDGRQMALMLLDVDGFKPVNDSFGHDAGDMLLIQIARRLARVLGSASLGVFRLGGDEFTAIFMSSGPDDTDSIARRVLDAIKEPFEHQGRIMRVTGSLGIAHFPRDGKDPAELMKFVDLALYRAKETKGSVVVFDRLKDAYLLRRAGLTRDIQSVVDKGEIEVYYQGIFEGDGTVVGIEALVRWHHPLLGMLMPREFLDIAVASNMIIPIETYVLSQACRHARELAADHGKEFFVLVNSTNTFFYSQDFIDIVRRTIERSGIDPGRLKLGLEERFSYGDPDRALAIIGELRKHRIEFAVDGLGGESSWLHFLKELPENTIVKIDRGFVRHIETSASDRTFLYRILSLLESRGFKVAVSGIENEEQQNMLKRRNCLFQGFALAEPITFEKLKPKLKSRSRRPAKGS